MSVKFKCDICGELYPFEDINKKDGKELCGRCCVAYCIGVKAGEVHALEDTVELLKGLIAARNVADSLIGLGAYS